MNPLILLTDKDIFPQNFSHSENKWQPTYRVTVRMIVLDQDGKIALCGTRYKLLPGGGVDAGESLEEAAKREAIEEIGCDVDIENEIGTSEEYRDNGKRHQITHCFVGRVIGEKGLPMTTQEDELGMKVYWYNPKEALEIIEEQIKTIPFESYNSCFNVRVHLAFLREYLK